VNTGVSSPSGVEDLESSLGLELLKAKFSGKNRDEGNHLPFDLISRNISQTGIREYNIKSLISIKARQTSISTPRRLVFCHTPSVRQYRIQLEIIAALAFHENASLTDSS